MKRLVSFAAALSMLLAVFSALAQTPRFTRDTTSNPNHPVVIDHQTGLQWQGCALGWTGKDCTTVASTTTFTWQQALSRCEAEQWAGASDWRLPNRKELRSIVDDRQSSSPHIDTTAFPATPAGDFWSSSTIVGDTGSTAWRVNFDYGYASFYDKIDPLYVRCVRSGP